MFDWLIDSWLTADWIEHRCCRFRVTSPTGDADHRLVYVDISAPPPPSTAMPTMIVTSSSGIEDPEVGPTEPGRRKEWGKAARRRRLKKRRRRRRKLERRQRRGRPSSTSTVEDLEWTDNRDGGKKLMLWLDKKPKEIWKMSWGVQNDKLAPFAPWNKKLTCRRETTRCFVSLNISLSQLSRASVGPYKYLVRFLTHSASNRDIEIWIRGHSGHWRRYHSKASVRFVSYSPSIVTMAWFVSFLR